MFSRPRLLILILILLLAGSWLFMRSRNGEVVVEEVRVRRGDLTTTLTGSGEIKAERDASLSFITSGRITYHPFQEGEQVTEGVVIASIDGTEAWQSLQNARIEKDELIDRADEIRETYGDDVGHGVGFYKLEQVERQIAQQDNNISIAQSQLGNLSLLAPFTGIILDKNYAVGENFKLTDGKYVARLVDLERVYFEAEIDEEDIAEISLGDGAQIELDSYPDRKFNGVVAEIDDFVSADEAGNKIVRVKLMFSRSDFTDKVLLGLSGDADIITNEYSGLILAPLDAVFFEGEEAYVFKRQDDVARRVSVTTDKENDSLIEITSGVQEGDVLLIGDPEELYEGVRISTNAH